LFSGIVYCNSKFSKVFLDIHSPECYNMPDAVLLLSTCGSREEAGRIAEQLIERRLAACVNIIPGLTSIYRWQGAIERSEELLLLIKTTAERASDTEAAVRELHSYETPEILRFHADGGAAPYLAWIAESVRRA
jgi:periplasmic divalent cation tolerance protein